MAKKKKIKLARPLNDDNSYEGHQKIIIIDGHKLKHVTCRDIGGVRPKYIGRNYVIKLEDGWNQTINEIKVYKKLRQYDRKFFPKFLSFSKKDGFIIQERIQFKKRTTIGRKERNRAAQIVERLIKRYGLNGDIESDTLRNWGIRKDGRPVIFDFGIVG